MLQRWSNRYNFKRYVCRHHVCMFYHHHLAPLNLWSVWRYTNEFYLLTYSSPRSIVCCLTCCLLITGARRDEDGYIWITGRIDDMLNVSGHLLSTADVESVLIEHPLISEAAVVARPHPVKGECLYCFVTVKDVSKQHFVLFGQVHSECYYPTINKSNPTVLGMTLNCIHFVFTCLLSLVACLCWCAVTMKQPVSGSTYTVAIIYESYQI